LISPSVAVHLVPHVSPPTPGPAAGLECSFDRRLAQSLVAVAGQPLNLLRQFKLQ
jgi:hypothetical protein